VSKPVPASVRAAPIEPPKEIVETSERERVTLRDAAYMIGVGRVAEATRLRGWV
jgi:glutamate dehydrogenase/leucine dehydrogenase